MSLRRFLVAPGDLAEETVQLDKTEANHARKVLRLGVGDRVQLLDGRGKRAEAEILQLGREGMTCKVLRIEDAEPLQPRLVLCPGLAKGPAMDLIAVKLTELAVDQIRPFMARRSEPKIKDAGARLDRWQRLAGQALKQCGAPRTPEFFEPVDFADLLESAPENAAKIMLYERHEGMSLARALADTGRAGEVWLIIGPEGGFDDSEVALAQNAGFTLCGLPGTILRAETACLAAASIVRFAL